MSYILGFVKRNRYLFWGFAIGLAISLLPKLVILFLAASQ